MPVLSQRALEGLRNYKYKPAGYTILDDLHQPIWNYITSKWLPNWLAPNLITLTGLITLIFSYIITAYYNIDFTYETPRWNYLLAAVAVFVYLHMDCLDGKQARKTGTSSPLGQLFDHGCDAFAVHLILINLITSLQLVHDWKSIMSALYVFIPWWLAHWEEYHTGVMLYGSGLWGVTEANYAVCLVHLFTYIVGPAGWTWTPFSFLGTHCDSSIEVIGRLCSFISGLQVNDALLLTFGFMGASLFLQQVVRVFKLSGSDTLLKTTLPTEERGYKDLGFVASGSHLLQILWTCLGCGAILMLPIVPPSHSRIVFEIFGINYAWQATRMIMAHMSKEPFQIAILPNILIMLQILNFFMEAFEPTSVAYAVLAGTSVGYLQYILAVISEICAFLDISALTIKSQKMD